MSESDKSSDLVFDSAQVKTRESYLVDEAEKYKTIANSLNFVSVDLRRRISFLESENNKLEELNKEKAETIQTLSRTLHVTEVEKSNFENRLEATKKELDNLSCSHEASIKIKNGNSAHDYNFTGAE